MRERAQCISVGRLVGGGGGHETRNIIISTSLRVRNVRALLLVAVARAGVLALGRLRLDDHGRAQACLSPGAPARTTSRAGLRTD